jgi:hypothetical protein
MTAVAELTGADLALWAARAAELEWPRIALDICRVGPLFAPIDFAPHEDWAQGGPLLEAYAIGFEPISDAEWLAEDHITLRSGRGPTPLIAAMRALVASIYGDTVPDEAAP